MAARVQVIVEAKDASSGVLRGITSQLGGLGRVIEDITGKNINWGNVAAQVTGMVVSAVNDTIKVTQEYAAEVRDLSLASGQGAEAASRMLQVLDDYQLTADDAATATRALTKNGLAPTIETVANLSGEYLKLNSAEDRNAFLQKNLGRASKEWLNLMAQGPAKIRAMNDAVDESLILTDENIRASEEYRLALDEWNDAVMGLKVSIGSELLPVMAEMMNGMANSNEIRAEANRLMMEGQAGNREEALSMAKLALAERDAATAAGELTQATDESALSLKEQEEAAKAAEEAAKALSDANKEFIGVLGSVAGAQTTYNEGIAAAKAELASGNITLDEYTTKTRELGDAFLESKNKIILSIVEMKLAQDGWTNAELSAYLRVGKSLGVFDQTMISTTESYLREADRLMESSEEVEEAIYHVGERSLDASGKMEELDDAQSRLGSGIRKDALPAAASLSRELSGIPAYVTSTVDLFINTYRNTYTGEGITPSGIATGIHGGRGAKQSGGQVYAGNPYVVGERGAEPFFPAQNGRVLGHAESLHAMTLGGGGNNMYFYGNVTISPDSESGSDLLSIR